MKTAALFFLFLVLFSSSSRADDAEADKLFRSGDYFMAMKRYTEILDQNPNDTHALTQRGLSICLEGSHDPTALQDETKAISSDSNLALAFAYRGYAYFWNGDADHALSDCQQAIQLDPKLGFAYATLAKIYAAKGDKTNADSAAKQALAAYSNAISNDGNDVVTLKERAQLLGSLGEYDRALADYEKILEVDPDNLAGQDGKASILATCPAFSLRDGKTALDMAKSVCAASHYEIASYYETWAAAHAEVGEFDEAVSCEQQYMRVHNHTPEETDAANARIARYRDQKPYRTSPAAVQHNGLALTLIAVMGMLFLFCFVGGPLLWNTRKLVIVPMTDGNRVKAGLLNLINILFWLIESFVGFYLIVIGELLKYPLNQRTGFGSQDAFKPKK